MVSILLSVMAGFPAAPLLLLVGCSTLFAPSPALLPPAQPRNWFLRTPAAAPPSLPKRSTVFVTATRVLTEVHLSSCIVPSDPLPACPNDDEPTDGAATPPYRLESVAASTAAGRLHTDYQYRAPSAERQQPDPREDGSRMRAGGRTFSGLQNMFMKILQPASSGATPPLPRSPPAEAGPVTRTVFVTRRTGPDVPTTTSTVSFTLSGCVPSLMPFPLEPCDALQNDRPEQLRLSPTATAAEAPATAALPDRPAADEEMMLNGPGSDFTGPLQGSEEEESGSGAHGE